MIGAFDVLVTKGDLQTIIGPAAYADMKIWCLDNQTNSNATLKTLARRVLVSLEDTGGLYLANPEITGVGGLMESLLAVGALTQAAVDKVNAYVAIATAVPSPPVAPPKTHRVPRPVNITTWQAQFAAGAVVVEGVTPLDGYIFVTGDCTDPAREEI